MPHYVAGRFQAFSAYRCPLNDNYLGIYNQKLDDEIQKAEVSWFFSPKLVHSASLTGQSQETISKHSAVRHTYSVVPLSLNSEDVTEMALTATYIDAKPNCYAIIMACPQAEDAKWQEQYKMLLNSLTITQGKPFIEQTPPPDRAPKPGIAPSETPGIVKNELKPDMPLPSITTSPSPSPSPMPGEK